MDAVVTGEIVKDEQEDCQEQVVLPVPHRVSA